MLLTTKSSSILGTPAMTTQLTFFDTVGLEQTQYVRESQRALSQEKRLHQILSDVGTHLTPYECHKLYEKKYRKCSIVSIRRALTRGTKAGLFEKVDIMKKGDWHLPNHQWRAIKIDK